MSRDMWQVRRSVIQTKKMRKYVEIPAFDYDCWYPRRSIKSVDAATEVCYLAFNDTFYKDAFTIELWAYTDHSKEDSNNNLLSIGLIGPTPYVWLTVSGGLLYVNVTKLGSVTSCNSVNIIPIGQWFHIAVTYDGTNVRLYLNGQLEATSGDVTAELDYNNFSYISLLANQDGTERFFGYVDEIRIWDSARSAADIYFYKDKHFVPLTSGLKFYFNMDDATDDGSTVTIPNDGELTNITANSGLSIELSTTQTAPIVLGASFVVAEFVTAIGNKASIKYPIAIPDDAENFGLFVSWVDNDGVFQRRKLFAPAGIDLAPNPADYAGERMPNGFKFEIINVDGEDHVTLGSTLTIELSNTSNPTSGTDHAQLEAQDLTADTTLAEDFPFGTDEMSFDTQQTY